MHPIADGSLGSQYWITTDLSRLSELYETGVESDRPVDAAGESVEPEKGVIGDDSVLTSLANGSESDKFKNVFGQAKTLAPLMAEEGQPWQALLAVAAGQMAALSDSESIEGLVAKTVRLSRHYIPEKLAKGGAWKGGENELAQRALVHVLLSKEFSERARGGDKIDRAGMLALVNATIGVMKMACEGKVDLEQPSDCMFGEVADLSKPADVLRLAVKTAQSAREKFVDESGLEDLVRNATAQLGDSLDPFADVDGLRSELQDQIDSLIRLRKEASQCLDLTFDLKDASVGEIEKNLGEARNAMRAFRYDLDCATGKKMGFMERLRRKLDDRFSRTTGNRMPPGHYAKILDCESKIMGILRRHGVDVPSVTGCFHGVKDLAELATNMTHATNNHIRYYFSGAETRREKFAKQAHEMFDPLVAKGGSRTVSFEVGLDVRAGFKAGEVVELDAGGGAKYVHTAKVSVSPGGGEVTVTYYDGAAVEGSVKGQVGTGKWDGKNTDKAKVGANFNGKSEVGGGKGRTVTYPSLDAFIADCNGENSLVDVGPKHSFLCLGKLYQGCRALLRRGRDLLAKLGFVIHKSVVDSRSYRAMLQRNGVMRKVDSILSNAPRHFQRTSEKIYGVFKAGGEVGGGMNVNLFRGIDEESGMEKSASALDLSGSLGCSGECQFNVHGLEMRARIDTLRMESDDMLEYRLDEAAEHPDTADLVEGFRKDGEDLSKLAERLVDLENEATDCDDDRVKWQRICRRLEALTVRYVQLERRLEDSKDVKRLESARAFFSERLLNPQMDIPEDLFWEMLVDVTSQMRTGKSIHKANFKLDYNVGTEFVADVAKSSPSSLQSDKPGVGLNYRQQVGQGAISNAVTSVMESVGAKGSVELAVTVEQPNGRDVRPWKNGKTVVFDVKLAPNLPVRALVRHVASKYVDSLTDEEKQSKDNESLMVETMAEILASMGLTTTLEALMADRTDPTRRALVAQVEKEEESPIDPDIDIASSSVQTIQFRFEHGRLACRSILTEEGSESTLGARFKAGPIGIGLHMKTGYSQSQIERSVYVNPHFDTLLGRTAEFLRGGTRSQLALFLAHNKVGTLKAFDDSTPTGRGVLGRIIGAEKMLNRIVNGQDVSVVAQNDKAHAKRSIVDRAERIQTMLEEAKDVFSGCDNGATDGEKLKALEDLLVALVRAYDIAKEAGVGV